MSQLRPHRRVPAVLAACVAIALGSMPAARAAVISSTPTLPLLGVPYLSSGAGCFPVATVCVVPGELTLTAVVSSTFGVPGQDIVADASYAGSLTTLGGTPIGPISLFGTVEEVVLGRTSATELGTWATDLVALSLSGPVLGHTLTLTLDPSTPSTGSTSIATADSNDHEFRIDSFFDVFVDLSLDTTPPLVTMRGPVHLSLVPEPASLALLAVGLLALPVVRRHRKQAARGSA